MNIEDVLLSQDIKPTLNRCEIMRVLLESDFPLSIKDFENTALGLDKSSIFRCLRLFAEHSLIHEIEDGSGALKYEFCHVEHTNEHTDLHPHFYCELCKRTICLTDIPIPNIKVTDGSIINSANFVLKGICSNCADNKNV